MRILVVGSNGQLAKCIKQATEVTIHKFTYIGRSSKYNLLINSDCKSMIEDIRPDIIINTAAYTKVDDAEIYKEDCDKLNFILPTCLAQECYCSNVRLIHISTDYVFGGDKSGELFETDVPNPINYYGLSKLRGESSVMSFDNNFIIRTSALYSEHNGKFINWSNGINVAYDQITKITNAHGLARAILSMIEMIDIMYPGVYHYADRGQVSISHVMKTVMEIKNERPNFTEVNLESFDTKARRPLTTILNCDKIRSYGINPPHWRDALVQQMSNL